MKNRPWMRCLLGVVAVLLVSLYASSALAFCGFFVAKADGKLYNSSSRVIIAHSGDRSVFTMANDYQGDVRDFARIVPIPVIPTREQVRIGDPEVVNRLDGFTAPRLVQYVDEPCRKEFEEYLVLGGTILVLGALGGLLWMCRKTITLLEVLMLLFILALLAAIAMPSFLTQANKAKGPVNFAETVVVEDQFTVGEYDVAILSAQESDGLTGWLTQNGYKVPANARTMLQDYIEQDMKFFVVKVNLDAFESEGFGFLRPIILDYRSPKFMLPMRLGTLNASTDQDLIIHILSPNNFAKVANYRNVPIPTDNHSRSWEPSGEELPAFIKDEFGAFYEAMFQQEYEQQGKNAVFLEYAGVTGKCDPCAMPPLTPEDLRAAGAFWVTSDSTFPGAYITRLHVRYTQENFPEDLFFREVNGDTLMKEIDKIDPYASAIGGVVFQGRYVIRQSKGLMFCRAGAGYRRWQQKWAKNLARLTGWKVKEIQTKMKAYSHRRLHS